MVLVLCYQIGATIRETTMLKDEMHIAMYIQNVVCPRTHMTTA